jgi:hypothetical protein
MHLRVCSRRQHPEIYALTGSAHRLAPSRQDSWMVPNSSCLFPLNPGIAYAAKRVLMKSRGKAEDHYFDDKRL